MPTVRAASKRTGQNPSTSVESFTSLTADNTSDVSSWWAEINEFFAREYMAISGTVRGLVIRLTTAPGTGTSWTFDILINGEETGITATVSDTLIDGNSGLAVTAAYSVGDYIQLRSTPTNTPTNPGQITWTVELIGTTANEVHYSGTFGTISNNDDAYVNGPFAGTGPSAATPEQAGNLVPIPGQITDIYAWLDGNPVTLFEFALMKNGVLLEDTRLELTESQVVFHLDDLQVDFAEGDIFHCVSLEHDAIPNRRVFWSIRAVSLVPGDFIVCENVGSVGTVPTATGTSYNGPWREFNYTTVGDENLTIALAPLTPNLMTLTKMFVRLTAAPGGAAVRTYTLRKNLATPGGSPTLSLTGSETTGEGEGAFTLTAGDVWGFQHARTVSASASTFEAVSWAAGAFSEFDLPDIIGDRSHPCACPPDGCTCPPAGPGGPGTGSPSSEPPETSTGPILPPEIPIGPVDILDEPYWEAACVGGGLVPTAADPVDSESWVS